MMKNHYFLAFVSFFVFTFAVHIFATVQHLYFTLWWVDIPMHMLGGVTVAAFSLWLYEHLTAREKTIVISRLPFMIMNVLIIGGLWEVYELLTGQTFNFLGSFPFDSLKDLAVDELGTYFVYAEERKFFNE